MVCLPNLRFHNRPTVPVVAVYVMLAWFCVILAYAGVILACHQLDISVKLVSDYTPAFFSVRANAPLISPLLARWEDG